mmetsp:Transcript_11320/g.34933  ORF Transcript_11320/g.34933 Transcript_11320/m.34933 type:complete len:91 (+) Transcript_11320:1977-2249(+)
MAAWLVLSSSHRRGHVFFHDGTLVVLQWAATGRHEPPQLDGVRDRNQEAVRVCNKRSSLSCFIQRLVFELSGVLYFRYVDVDREVSVCGV